VLLAPLTGQPHLALTLGEASAVDVAEAIQAMHTAHTLPI
jgi:hypothetical protein